MQPLTSASDGLEQAVRTAALPGWDLRYIAVAGSTQDLAREAARAGASGGTVFVADYQAAGRGRQGRRWVAAPGTALLLSALFRERAPAARPLRYTALVSVALAEAIEEVAAPLRPAIKWPNDLLLGDRKVAGVLAEAAWDGEQLAVVVGAGTNVRGEPARLAGVGHTATSLEAELGRSVDRGELLMALLRRMDAWLACPDEELRARWQERLWGRGQVVRLRGLDGGESDQEVVVLGVEPDGALRVRRRDGAEATTLTAEVIL